MNSASTQFFVSRRMNIYEPLNQISSWVDSYRDDDCLIPASAILDVEDKLENLVEDTSLEALPPSNRHGQGTSRSSDKVQRRLAQNREAARKSRLRKKAYVQQLELSRSKLIQLEQELERTRQQQGVFVGGGIDHLPLMPTVNSGIVAFEMEYKRWIEQQNKQVCELRNALNTQINDVELRSLVDSGMSHYFDLFQLKATAAKADIFYLISGMWKTPAERFFLWIGGFRPSELLKVLGPQLDPLTEQQVIDVYNLKQACEQAEEALSQGMDKLQQTLAETVAAGQLGEGSYVPHMTNAMEKLEALLSFVNQADHLRKETLQQMYRILPVRQAARGLLALGEYLQRLRALSSYWSSRSSESSA